MEIILVLTLMLVIATVAAGVHVIKKKMNREQTFRILGVSVGTFIVFMIGATVFMLSGYNAAAADHEVVEAGLSIGEGLKFLGAALSTGLACIGTGTAVAASASAAIGAISEDPKLLGRTVIFVGLSEGIAIYGLIISIMILG